MLIFDYLVILIFLSTPIMAILSLPLSLEIASSLHRMTGGNGSATIRDELRQLVRYAALLLLPHALGTLTIAPLTVYSERMNSITNVVIVHIPLVGTVLLLALFTGFFRAANAVLAGESKGVRLMGFWVGLLWTLLYVSLGIQLFSYCI